MAKERLQIAIEVTDPVDGDIEVRPGYAHVAAKGTITWTAMNATSLLVAFEDGTAVESAPPGKSGRRGASRPAHVELRADSADGQARDLSVSAVALGPGMFGYRIALVVGGKVYADMSCPEIIIE